MVDNSQQTTISKVKYDEKSVKLKIRKTVNITTKTITDSSKFFMITKVMTYFYLYR